MTRRRRTYILIEGDPNLRNKLRNEICTTYEVLEIEAPNYGLVMVTMREAARQSLFHPGELFVTEAKAQVGGQIGLGLIVGDAPEAAWALAVIDAAYRARLPETDRWEPRLLAEETRIEAARLSHEARILETRVSFETMEEQRH